MDGAKIYLSSDLKDYTIKYLTMQGGKTLAFSFNGMYKGEVKTFDFGKIDEVDLVSVLHFEGGYELAAHVGRVFRIIKTTKPLLEVYNTLNSHNGVVCRGVKNGEKDGVKYKQYFFSFKPNTLNMGIFE